MIRRNWIMLSMIALLASVIFALSVLVLRPAFGSEREYDKVVLCHKTDSEENPWVSIEVGKKAVKAHLEHGDFKVDEEHPCPPKEEGPTPTPTPTPEVTLTVTPTPKPFDPLTDQEDKCPEPMSGVQSVVPQGMFVNDKGICEDIVKVATPAPVIAATTLPATGSDSLLLGLWLLGMGLSLKLLEHGLREYFS